MNKPEEERELTPAEQALMDFLGDLMTAPSMTPELLNRGNQALDDAANEYKENQEDGQT